MEFVASASVFYKKYSTWIFGFIAAVSMATPFLPALQLLLSPQTYGIVIGLVALAGIFATQLKQAGVTAPEAPKDPS